MVPIWMQ
ncbi:hypothetical protein PHET_09716 [Paragonimus heterotremus]|nr:hypothetical protein PHET_09716 [Paragonimus heterotremus]